MEHTKSIYFIFNVATKNILKRCLALSWGNMVDYFSIKSSFTLKDKYIQKGLVFCLNINLNYIHKIGNELFKKITKRLNSIDPNDESEVLEIIKIKLLVKKSIKVGDKILGKTW